MWVLLCALHGSFEILSQLSLSNTTFIAAVVVGILGIGVVVGVSGALSTQDTNIAVADWVANTGVAGTVLLWSVCCADAIAVAVEAAGVGFAVEVSIAGGDRHVGVIAVLTASLSVFVPWCFS